MEQIKNNYELVLEEIRAKQQPEVDANPIFGGADLNIMFQAIEESLDEYRIKSEKKYNDSQMELANVFLNA